jgi:hypothetical protein
VTIPVPRWLTFDIHDRVRMRVAHGASTAAQLKDMFAPFVVDDSAGPFDITVTDEIEAVVEGSYGEHDYEYNDDALYMSEAKVQIVRHGDELRVHGTREMLTTVLPLVDRVATVHGAAMVHAAYVDYQGHGVCMPAWGGVGKTSTVAKLLKIDGVGFMGDDWGFLSDDGRLLGYAKPMFIKPHHRPIYPHLFAEKRKPLVPSRLSRPIGRFTTVVHPMVTRYPRFARVIRKWSPEHMMHTPQEAFPGARISTDVSLDILMFVERFNASHVSLQPTSEAWMVSRLVGNFHAEMSLHSREVVVAMGATGLVPIESFFGDKRAVLARAVAGKPTYLLRVPASMPADHASDVIVEQLQKAMADAGVV